MIIHPLLFRLPLFRALDVLDHYTLYGKMNEEKNRHIYACKIKKRRGILPCGTKPASAFRPFSKPS